MLSGWRAVPKQTQSVAKALQILDRPTSHPVEREDRLPRSYVSVRRKYDGKERSNSSRRLYGEIKYITQLKTITEPTNNAKQ